ncbi:hypothetical protein D3C84_673110 [compost metagenome]
MPDHALLEAVLQRGDLRQRYAATVVRRYGQARQQRQLRTLMHGAAQQDLDQLVVFAVLTDTGTGQRALQKLRQVRRAHAQCSSAVLIDVQVHDFAWFFPIKVNVDHMRVFPNLGRDFTRQGPNFLDVLTRDPELHRIANRRAVFQARDPRPQRRELFVERRDQPRTQGFAVLDGLGQHHNLGEARSRQLLIQRQVKTRRTGADVSHVVIDPGLVLEQGFKAFDLLGGVAQGSAFGEFQVDHQLQSAGRGEELLRHKTEQHDGGNEQHHGRRDHGFTPAHAPFHQTPDALIERCSVRVWLTRTVFRRMNFRQIR